MSAASAASGPPAPRPYASVLLVYNPESSGGGEGKAHTLARDLRELAPELDVQLVPTEYGGHARRIAESAARTYRLSLIHI